MSDATPRFRAFMTSIEWSNAVKSGIQAQEEAMAEFLRSLDPERDILDGYHAVLSLFSWHAGYGDRAKADEDLARLASISVPSSEACWEMVARAFLEDFGDMEAAHFYIMRAYDGIQPGSNQERGVVSLDLTIEVKRDPKSARVQELLFRINELAQGRIFSDGNLLGVMQILVLMGLVPWWGYGILEAIWAGIAIKSTFYSYVGSEALRTVEDLYRQLPSRPTTVTEMLCDLNVAAPKR